MGWSRTVSGSDRGKLAREILLWPAEQEATDRKAGASEAVISGHQAQVKCATEAVVALARTHPGKRITVNVTGEANEDRTGNLSLTYLIAEPLDEDAASK